MLDACKYLSIAVVSNGLPRIHLVRYQELCPENVGLGLVVHLDTRSELYATLVGRSDPAEGLWHFPLTKEVFRLTITRVSEAEPA
jgi:hypothetical protein